MIICVCPYYSQYLPWKHKLVCNDARTVFDRPRSMECNEQNNQQQRPAIKTKDE